MLKFVFFSFIYLFSVAGFSANKCSALFETTYTEDQIKEASGKTHTYQDVRNKEWLEKQKCLCCHTTLPYVLSRSLDANSKNNMEKLRAMAELSVENPMGAPWYTADNAGKNSKPTEAVLTAITLVMSDVSAGTTISPVSKKALDQIFERVEASGKIHWLDYALQPFESKDAEGWGNAMAILAVEIAKNKSDYTPPAEKYTALKNNLLNNAENLKPQEMSVLLWANSYNKTMLSSRLVKKFTSQLIATQNTNGSWNQKSVIGLGLETADAYSTAIATIGLISAGKEKNSAVKNAIDWLVQSSDYSSISMNRPRSRFNNTLSTDIATSYSALALSLYNEKRAR